MAKILQRYDEDIVSSRESRTNYGYFMPFVDLEINEENGFKDYISRVWYTFESNLPLIDNRYMDQVEHYPSHHNNDIRVLRTKRSFRRYLKKMSKIYPNGLVVQLDSRFIETTKNRRLILEGRIKNNLSIEDSLSIIQEQMREWSKSQ